MILDEQAIFDNENRFIELISSIDREGSLIEDLLHKLKNSDFFTAPASTKYHSSFKGGLCYHSLNVYDNLCKLVAMKYGDIPFDAFDKNSLKIVALLHDISKAHYYEQGIVNKKEYSPGGSKKDNLGNYEWVSETIYKVKDPMDRQIFGSHGQNSERTVSYYIPLTTEESLAIIWHMGGMDDFKCQDLPYIFNNYPLVSLLHAADYISTYLDEKI